ncbi:uncharacterized protein LOC142985508 [Anticarsia gemmatalis]|uniref:uncharacterized protein LOC142985508 n=1 Tax=Anticarsia gemmatalis TaxID=129554 RepID=UPI003F760B06
MESFGTSKRKKHVKYTFKTTKDYTTMRQMYVEKNLDLKYDPNAYKRFEERKNKQSVETKRQSDSKESNVDSEVSSEEKPRKLSIEDGKSDNSDKYTKNDSPERQETKPQHKYSRDSRSHLKNKNGREHKTKKKGKTTTEEVYTFKQMYVEKNLDLKYDLNAYDHLTTRNHRKIKKKSHKTLYPEFEKSTAKFRTTRKAVIQTTYRKRKTYFKNEREDTDVLTTSPAFIEVEVKKPRAPQRVVKDKKFKIEIHLKKAQKSTQDIEPVTVRSTDPQKRFKVLPHEVTHDYRRYPVFSVENLSLEEFQKHKEVIKPQYRRSNVKIINTDKNNTVTIDKNVLTRIEELENELKAVKTQIKNDTEIIKRLDSKVRETEIKEANFKINEDKILEKSNYDDNLDTAKTYRIDVSKINQEFDTQITENFNDIKLRSLEETHDFNPQITLDNKLNLETTEKQQELSNNIIDINPITQTTPLDYNQRQITVESRKNIDNFNPKLMSKDDSYFTKIYDQLEDTTQRNFKNELDRIYSENYIDTPSTIGTRNIKNVSVSNNVESEKQISNSQIQTTTESPAKIVNTTTELTTLTAVTQPEITEKIDLKTTEKINLKQETENINILNVTEALENVTSQLVSSQTLISDSTPESTVENNKLSTSGRTIFPELLGGMDRFQDDGTLLDSSEKVITLLKDY